MRRFGACAALVMVALTSCTGESGGSGPATSTPSSAGTPAPATAPATGTRSGTSVGCPTDKAQIEKLLGATITHTEGATTASTAQLCAFTTSTTDPGALGVVFLRFPRSDLRAKTLAEARRLYGSKLAGHTIIAMPSWGTDAFLDESVLPDANLTAEFAWVPGYEIILGMHSDDPHVAERRQLIDRLVAITR